MFLGEAIDKYISYVNICNYSKATTIGYKKQLGYFNRFLTETYNCPIYLNEITISDMESYLIYMSKKGIASSSRARFIYIMRAFYDYCTKNSLCTGNIAAGIKAIKYHNKERSYLSEDEVEKILWNINKPLVGYVIKTLLYSGMRISECLSLEKNDIDIANKVIRIVKGKGSKARVVPICGKLLEMFYEYMKSDIYNEASDYFFATGKTGRLSACYVNSSIKEAVRLSGIKKSISAHTFRHTFASNLVKNNVNIVNIQKLLGHANINATSIYTHSSIEDLNDAVNIL